MAEKGEPASRWLAKITDDQNLHKLSDLILTRMSDARRWFVSRILQGTLYMGYYDESTGRYVLGGRRIDDPNVLKHVVNNNDTTSVASKAWTATGNGWIILGASANNATAAPTWRTTLTPLGGTETTISDAGATVGGIYSSLYGIYNATTGSGMGFAPPNFLVLDVGDIFTIYEDGFAGADDTDYNIWYVQL